MSQNSPYKNTTTVPILNIKDAKERGFNDAIYTFRMTK